MIQTSTWLSLERSEELDLVLSRVSVANMYQINTHLAQLGEHRPYKAEVAGSNPAVGTI